MSVSAFINYIGNHAIWTGKIWVFFWCYNVLKRDTRHSAYSTLLVAAASAMWHPLPTPITRSAHPTHVITTSPELTQFSLKMAPVFRGIVDSFLIYFPGFTERHQYLQLNLKSCEDIKLTLRYVGFCGLGEWHLLIHIFLTSSANVNLVGMPSPARGPCWWKYKVVNKIANFLFFFPVRSTLVFCRFLSKNFATQILLWRIGGWQPWQG